MTSPSLRRGAATFAALVSLAAAASAGVIVVDFAGGGDFTTVQAAVNAAAEGDTILIEPTACSFCTLSGFVVNGKSLTIVADTTAPPYAVPYQPILVWNLQPGQHVVLRGLRVAGTTPAEGAAIWLLDNAGSVWIEDCDLTGSLGQGDAPFLCAVTADVPGGAGVEADGCAAVTIMSSTLHGGAGGNAYLDPNGLHFNFQATDGGPGLLAKDSQVAVYASALIGGVGGSGHLCAEQADGGFGAVAESSMVLVAGCTVTGGVQGAGPPAGAPGGGLRSDGASSYELLDTGVAAAPGGVTFDTAPGTLTTYSGVARVFQATSPLREGQAGTLSIQGVQGDFVGFFWAFNSGFLPKPVYQGWFLLNVGFVSGPYLIGAIGSPTGEWSIPFVAPNLPPAAQAQTFLLQAYFAYPGGATLGSGTAFTLLDASF